ncbi:hypothetical protein TRIP_E370030 [uncultured Spirochaetota bacterium]|nr:hypothetical protein TRIP_E370030 [uncultured Spirochaetota bacterium]
MSLLLFSAFWFFDPFERHCLTAVYNCDYVGQWSVGWKYGLNAKILDVSPSHLRSCGIKFHHQLQGCGMHAGH